MRKEIEEIETNLPGTQITIVNVDVYRQGILSLHQAWDAEASHLLLEIDPENKSQKIACQKGRKIIELIGSSR